MQRRSNKCNEDVQPGSRDNQRFLRKPKSKDSTGPRTDYEFLQTINKQGSHGEAFGYKTANTDCLGWVIARVTGQSIAQLLSERIWSRMGAEQDAYFSVDSIGTHFAGGGLNLGLIDLHVLANSFAMMAR